VSSDEATVFWQAVQNSAIIAVVATTLAVVLGSMAAFALSRYAFRGRDGLFLFFTAGLLFPLNTAALPLFLMLQKIGMNDNLLGVACPKRRSRCRPRRPPAVAQAHKAPVGGDVL
jgi:raffinose/stachyose/melibiose transport system permease protein